MKTLLYRLPIGGSIHIRGVAGLVTALDRPEGNMVQINLDPANSVPGKIRMIEYCGRLEEEFSSERYYDMQMFASPKIPPKLRVIDQNSLKDDTGESSRAAKRVEKYEIAFEYDLQPTLLGPNIWLGVMVGLLGPQTVEVLADRKVIRSRTFNAEPIPEQRFKNLSDPSDLVFTIHTDQKTGPLTDKVTIGDVVSFGLLLSELDSVADLQIRVR